MSGCEVATLEEVTRLIEPSLLEMGFEVVQVRLLSGARRTLQVMAEPVDRERTMTVDDCAEISRTVSALLDVADPIPGAYTLEVSSPGIDRPLVKLPDFERFAGFEAKVELVEPVDGIRRLKGKLLGLVGESRIAIVLEDGAVELPFESIKKAKLTLSDELIAASTSAH